jgi:hypothetical protein
MFFYSLFTNYLHQYLNYYCKTKQELVKIMLAFVQVRDIFATQSFKQHKQLQKSSLKRESRKGIYNLNFNCGKM